MSCPEPLKSAIKLYNDGETEACIEQVNSILTDTSPLYTRIRCRILLGHEERHKAEITLPHWRYSRRPGNKAPTEGVYKELCGLLDNLAEELRPWRPDDCYEHQRFWTNADAKDRDAAITKALEDWTAEQAEGEEEVPAELAENDEEKATAQFRGLEEEAIERAKSEEEMATKPAKVYEQNADDDLSLAIIDALNKEFNDAYDCERTRDALLNQTAVPSTRRLRRRKRLLASQSLPPLQHTRLTP